MMVRIRCVNRDCTGPDKKFDWDEIKHAGIGSRIVQPHTPGAKSIIAVCLHCGTENKVWVSGFPGMEIKKPDEVMRNERRDMPDDEPF